MSNGPITIEQTYDAPRDAVWRAITEKDLMRQWFFEQIEAFEAEVGFETCFDVECEGTVYPHDWKVTEVVPETRLVYDWKFRGFPGAGSVAWELSDTPSGSTRLLLTYSGWETFSQDNPIFTREAGEAGWSYFLNQSLVSFFEGVNG